MQNSFEREEEINEPILIKKNTQTLNLVNKIDGILIPDNVASKTETIEKIDYSKIIVLLVDDDQMIIKLNKIILEKLGIVSENLLIANNGKDAIGEVMKHDFDIILMDRQMPIIGGDEASIEIKKLRKDIPILCLSAIKEGIKNQIYDSFLQKPYRISSLKEKMEEAILKKLNK